MVSGSELRKVAASDPCPPHLCDHPFKTCGNYSNYSSPVCLQISPTGSLFPRRCGQLLGNPSWVFSEWDHDPLRRGFSIKSPIENETRTSEGWEGLSRSGHFCKAPCMKSTCKTRENKREHIQLWHTNNENIYNVCSKHVYYIYII